MRTLYIAFILFSLNVSFLFAQDRIEDLYKREPSRLKVVPDTTIQMQSVTDSLNDDYKGPYYPMEIKDAPSCILCFSEEGYRKLMDKKMRLEISECPSDLVGWWCYVDKNHIPFQGYMDTTYFMEITEKGEITLFAQKNLAVNRSDVKYLSKDIGPVLILHGWCRPHKGRLYIVTEAFYEWDAKRGRGESLGHTFIVLDIKKLTSKSLYLRPEVFVERCAITRCKNTYWLSRFHKLCGFSKGVLTNRMLWCDLE